MIAKGFVMQKLSIYNQCRSFRKYQRQLPPARVLDPDPSRVTAEVLASWRWVKGESGDAQLSVEMLKMQVTEELRWASPDSPVSCRRPARIHGRLTLTRSGTGYRFPGGSCIEILSTTSCEYYIHPYAVPASHMDQAGHLPCKSLLPTINADHPAKSRSKSRPKGCSRPDVS